VNGACGIFRITRGFWLEGGQLTLPNDTTLSDNGNIMKPDVSSKSVTLFPTVAFVNCVNDPYCAADTIQSYMGKYGQDCNGDEHINCEDYGALHKLGNLNCRGELPYSFAKVFNRCLKRKQQLEAKAKAKAKEQSSN